MGASGDAVGTQVVLHGWRHAGRHSLVRRLFHSAAEQREWATGTPMGAPWPTSNSVKSARWSAVHPLYSPPCGMRRCGQACGLGGLAVGSGKAGEGPGTCMVYPHPPCTPTKTCHAAFPWYLFFIGNHSLFFFSQRKHGKEKSSFTERGAPTPPPPEGG